MGKLHIESIGKNSQPPLILLHGWNNNSDILRPLGTLLADKYHSLLIDLPGFGDSELPTEAWSAFDYADRIVAFMDEKGLSKVDLLGHSFGGKIAMSLAIRYPDRLGKLIIIGSAGLQRKRTLSQKLRAKSLVTAGKFIKLIDRSFNTTFYPDKFIPRFGSKDYKDVTGVLRAILVKSINEDYTSIVSKITAPTLIIYGEHDDVMPVEIGERLHKAIKGSKFYVFPEKPHHPFLDVGAHLCAHYIKRFLNEEL